MSVVPNGIYKDNNENNDGVNGITFAEHLFVLYQYFFPHLTLQGSYKFKDFSRTFQGLSSTTFLNFKDLI